MHFLVGVIVPADTTVDEAEAVVGPLLAPFNEDLRTAQDDEGYWYNPDGWWDWWQVGGRWVGTYSEYSPELDPANQEVCSLCSGTGTRPGGLEQFGQEWFDWCHGCNGCSGKGTRPTWPTQWVPCPDDVVPVKVLVNNPTLPLPYRLVLPDQTVIEAVTYEMPKGAATAPSEEDEMRAALAEHADMAMVVVDCHC